MHPLQPLPLVAAHACFPQLLTFALPCPVPHACSQVDNSLVNLAKSFPRRMRMLEDLAAAAKLLKEDASIKAAFHASLDASSRPAV